MSKRTAIPGVIKAVVENQKHREQLCFVPCDSSTSCRGFLDIKVMEGASSCKSFREEWAGGRDWARNLNKEQA